MGQPSRPESGVNGPKNGVAPSPSPALAKPAVRLIFESEKKLMDVTGEIVVQAQDGGRLLLAPDGRLHVVQPKAIQREETLSDLFKAMTAEEIGQGLLEELPSGFKIKKTDHYVVCYNTTDAYANWVSALFERLYDRFHKYWKTRDIKLVEPQFPMIALVFETKQSYLKYAEPELGRSAESMLGYYNLMSNRVTTFDLTGIEGMIPDGMRVTKSGLVHQILSRPESERTVATIVHEAVHQIAYNCGLQVRLADNPVWVSEGLAVFFETPDLRSRDGWGEMGKINTFNLINFRNYLPQRGTDGLIRLLSEDKRFRDPKTVNHAYGESWALNYFLLKTRGKDYARYLKYLSNQPPLGESDAKQRIADFQEFFGDLTALDREFVKYIGKL
jgi:hypothetical protein